MLAEHGADQGGLHDGRQPGAQGEDTHEQLRQVPEGRLQQAGRAGAEPLADLFDGLTDQGGQGGQGQAGQDEPGDRPGVDRGRHAGEAGERHGRAEGDPVVRLEMSQVGGGGHGRAERSRPGGAGARWG